MGSGRMLRIGFGLDWRVWRDVSAQRGDRRESPNRTPMAGHNTPAALFAANHMPILQPYAPQENGALPIDNGKSGLGGIGV
jgi:hypothetical protein